jgi:hypothetical protein
MPAVIFGKGLAAWGVVVHSRAHTEEVGDENG